MEDFLPAVRRILHGLRRLSCWDGVWSGWWLPCGFVDCLCFLGLLCLALDVSYVMYWLDCKKTRSNWKLRNDWTPRRGKNLSNSLNDNLLGTAFEILQLTVLVVSYYKTKVKWKRFITWMDIHENPKIKHATILRKSGQLFAHPIIKHPNVLF